MTTAREGGPQAPILLTPAHRALQHRPGAAPEPAAPSGGDDGFGHASGSESSNSGWRAAGAWDLAEAVATSGQWRKDGATEAVRAMAAQWASLRGARREAVEQAGEVARRVVDDARHHRDASLLAGEQSKRAAAAVLSSSAHTPPVNAPQHSGGEARADEPGGQRIMENGRRRNRGPNARRGPGSAGPWEHPGAAWNCTYKRHGIKSALNPEATVAVENSEMVITWQHFAGLGLQKTLRLTPLKVIGAELLKDKERGGDAQMVRVHWLEPPAPVSPEGETEHHCFDLVQFRDRKGEAETHERVLACCDRIQAMANTVRPLSGIGRLLLIVNPVSGHRLGQAYYEKVKPLMDAALEAGRRERERLPKPYDTLMTTHAGHAHEVVQQLRLGQADSDISGIICVGGDGTVSEVVNSIMQRPDAKEFLEQVTIGTIPAGSECALAKMVSYLNPISAAYTILKGHAEQRLDILKVTQGSKVVHSICGLGWGIAGKLAEDSEAMRSVFGPARYLVSGIKSFVNLKGVQGYLTIEAPKKRDQEVLSECRFARRCAVCEARAAQRDGGGPEEEVEEITWRGPFIVVAMLKSEKTLAPHVHLSDGYMDVLAVDGDINHFNLVKASSRIITGDHLSNNKEFRYIKARSVKLYPEDSRDKINVDGEVMDGEETEVRVVPAAIRMFVAREKPHQQSGGDGGGSAVFQSAS